MDQTTLIKYAESSLSRWRKRLRIDRKWDIEIAYSSEPMEDDKDCACWCNDDKANYWRIKLTFYPPVLEYKTDATIRKRVDWYIAHELWHIFMWPMSSFVRNVVNAKLYNEFLKHEEQMCSLLEEIVTNQKPGHGVKLAWGNDDIKK